MTTLFTHYSLGLGRVTESVSHWTTAHHHIHINVTQLQRC